MLGGYSEPVRVEGMQALLRDHAAYGGDLPRGASELPSICMHAGPGATGETAASMVAHLRPNQPRELTATVWTAFGSPCLSVYRPVYPFAVGLPTSLDRGGARFDPASPWWAFERLQRLVAQAPDLAAPTRAALGALEVEFRQRADAAEAEAGRLLARGERDAAITVLRQLVDGTSAEAAALAERLADVLAPRAARNADPALAAAWVELNAAVGLEQPAASPVA